MVCFSNPNGNGGFSQPTCQNTNNDGVVHTRFWHSTDGNVGETGDIRATVGGISATTSVEFGGNPASCSIVVDPHDLDIGDIASITATFVTSGGFKVPDGLIGSLMMVQSGESGANATILNSPEDTVNSMYTGQATTAIAGDSTVSATLQAIGLGGGDISCAEHLEFTGDVHQHPDVCEEDPDFILFGNVPPGGNFEWGTFAYCGGTFETLVEVSGCDADTAIFWYNTPAGGWEQYVPGSDVAAVNAAIFARFPGEHGSIPHGTIFTAACSAS
jgi:hypothetical protein